LSRGEFENLCPHPLLERRIKKLLGKSLYTSRHTASID